MRQAIIETGGKQHLVTEGDTLEIEKVTGKTLSLTPLLVTDGGKTVAAKSPKVNATVVTEIKGRKVIVFKMKPKKGYRRKAGHRQQLSRIKIDKITA